MDDKTILEWFDAIRTMETTAEIAQSLDKVISVIGNADGSNELVAAVIVAQILSGKGAIRMVDTQ